MRAGIKEYLPARLPDVRVAIFMYSFFLSGPHLRPRAFATGEVFKLIEKNEVYRRFTNSVNCINISVMKKFIVTWCIFLLAGCAHFKEISRVDSLEKISVLYEKTLRWGSYEEAVLFMEEGPEQQSTNVEELNKFKVTSYEMLSRDISPDMFNAQQTVEIKYYHNQYLIEQTLVDKQVWKYNQDNKTWLLKSGLPDFK